MNSDSDWVQSIYSFGLILPFLVMVPLAPQKISRDQIQPGGGVVSYGTDFILRDLCGGPK